MINVIFNFYGIETIIKCKINEKMVKICERFASEINIDIYKLNFLYNGKIVNNKLTINEILSEIDNEINTLNIFVKLNDKNNKNDKIKLEKKIRLNEYMKKINYNFKKNPNFKYKLDITTTNDSYGLNDIFEVFISFKDIKEYIASPNYKNYNIDIYRLLDNKKITQLYGHNENISTIRYFINNKDYKEYLISADWKSIVIIWDITDNYKNKYIINTLYNNWIYSCLLIFPNNDNVNYIITSSKSGPSKIYSLNNAQFINCFKNSKNISIFYLLLWYNKKNDNYFIIQLANGIILINNLYQMEIYSKLVQKEESEHYSGFIYNKDDNDYLCCSSLNGLVNIWDLYNQKIFKIINTNKCLLYHIIQWNNRYIIVADLDKKSFKVIDIINERVISNVGGQHSYNVKCIKKIYHPIYGECLLSCDIDKTIKLWTI